MENHYDEDDQRSFEEAIASQEAADEQEAYEQQADADYADFYYGQPG